MVVFLWPSGLDGSAAKLATELPDITHFSVLVRQTTKSISKMLSLPNEHSNGGIKRYMELMFHSLPIERERKSYNEADEFLKFQMYGIQKENVIRKKTGKVNRREINSNAQLSLFTKIYSR